MATTRQDKHARTEIPRWKWGAFGDGCAARKKKLSSISWEGLLFRVPLAEPDGTLGVPFGALPLRRQSLKSRPTHGTWPRRRPAVMHGAKASDVRCGASDERADKARRAACPEGQPSTRQGFACGCERDGPVPSGAGGGLRITALASLERAPPFLRSAKGSGLPKDLLRAVGALGWDARRGDDDRVAPFLGAATRRTAQRAAIPYLGIGP